MVSLRLACWLFLFFFFYDTAPTEIYTLSLHDALPIWFSPFTRWISVNSATRCCARASSTSSSRTRSEEHTSELQSRRDLVCRLLLEKKKNRTNVPRVHSDQSSISSHSTIATLASYTFP